MSDGTTGGTVITTANFLADVADVAQESGLVDRYASAAAADLAQVQEMYTVLQTEVGGSQDAGLLAQLQAIAGNVTAAQTAENSAGVSAAASQASATSASASASTAQTQASNAAASATAAANSASTANTIATAVAGSVTLTAASAAAAATSATNAGISATNAQTSATSAAAASAIAQNGVSAATLELQLTMPPEAGTVITGNLATGLTTGQLALQLKAVNTVASPVQNYVLAIYDGSAAGALLYQVSGITDTTFSDTGMFYIPPLVSGTLFVQLTNIDADAMILQITLTVLKITVA